MPLHPLTLGFRFDIRVETLTAADAVEFICAHCGKRYLIAPYQLRLKFRPLTHLNLVADRFHCRSCGGRGKPRWSVYRAETLLSEVSE